MDETKKPDFHHRVEIVDYQENWPKRYAEEATAIIHSLDMPHRIRHVGSTSIPGMAGRPIIDLLLTVEADRLWEASQKLVKECGYTFFGECGRPGRLFMSKGNSADDTFYLHLTTEDNQVAVDQLAFRDVLLLQPAVAHLYTELKKQAANEFPDNRESYRQSKEGFITGVLIWAPREKR